jgi:hypothetical protein
VQIRQCSRDFLLHGRAIKPAQPPAYPSLDKQFPAKEHVGHHVTLKRERQVLIDHADAGLGRIARAGESAESAPHLDFPGRRPLRPGHEPHERRFTGAIVAD